MHKVYSSLRKSAVHTIQLLGYFTVACFLLSHFDWLWWFDNLTHFVWPYCVCLLIAAVVMQVERKRWSALLFLLVSFYNAALIGQFLFKGQGEPDGEASLRILSWNIWLNNQNHAEVLDYILKSDADIVLLYEVTPEWDESLKPLEDMYPETRKFIAGDSFGISLYTRVPGASPRNSVYLRGFLPGLVVDMDWQGLPLSVVGIHPVPPKTKEARELRDRHLHALAQKIADDQRTLILAGDFNASPWSPVMKGFVETTDMRYAFQGGLPLPTWVPVVQRLEQLMPYLLPIDHILVDADLCVVSYDIGPSNGSDHAPLIVDIQRVNKH